MATKTTAAFLAGMVTGWAMRSALGSSRETVVRAIVLLHQGRDHVKRVVAERVEWLDDLLAEGRARYEGAAGGETLDDEAPPHVAHEEHAA
jgi:hypothetical protein